MFWVDDDFLVAQTDFNNGVTRGNQGEIYGGGGGFDTLLAICENWQPKRV